MDAKIKTRISPSDLANLMNGETITLKFVTDDVPVTKHTNFGPWDGVDVELPIEWFVNYEVTPKGQRGKYQNIYIRKPKSY